jgi:hypothetical protein
VLGVEVRDRVVPGGPGVVLFGAFAGPRGPDSGDRRRVDHALDAGPQRLLEHDLSPLDVEREDLRPRRHQVGRPGDVKQPLDAQHRAPDRPAIQDVGAHLLDVEPGQRVQARAVADGDHDVVAALQQQGCDMRTDETGRACDKRPRHLVGPV